jgi:hypothetical protein
VSIAAIALVAWIVVSCPASGQGGNPGRGGNVGTTGPSQVIDPEPSATRRLAFEAFGIGAILSFLAFLFLLVKGYSPQLDSHWGGFGGGLGGWRLSPAAALLLVTLVLSGLAAMVIMPPGNSGKNKEQTPETPVQQSGSSQAGSDPGAPPPSPTPSGTPQG